MTICWRRAGIAVAALLGSLAASLPAAAQNKPIRVGLTTALQLQVGRDSVDALQMAIDEVNAKGGALGRKIEMVVADETENPETGINAVKKLTGDDKVDVLIGGYTSGVTLAQLPHISRAKTIYLGIGASSPAITQRVKQDYENYRYVFRVGPQNSVYLARDLIGFIHDVVIAELGCKKIAIVGENAKWVQDLAPILKKGATDAGAEVSITELFDTQTSDFSPLLAKVRESGAQFIIHLLSHASSDVFVKQWYDARTPIPIGGIDVKSQDPDFFTRVGGKAVSQMPVITALRSPLTPKTVPFWDAFVKKTGRAGPVYTAFNAYAALNIYVEAVTRAKTTDTDAVIKELEKTDYLGPGGRVQFDDSHDAKSGPGLIQLLVFQWQENGQRVVVWPKEKRDGKVMMPPWLQK